MLFPEAAQHRSIRNELEGVEALIYMDAPETPRRLREPA